MSSVFLGSLLRTGQLNEVFRLNGTLRNEELDCILNKHADLFREGYDGMKGVEAHIRVREGASPIYFKSCPVPFALRDAVEAELNKLEEHGVIVKVDHTEWASPIVVVSKADGSVRICGDYKVTVTINQVVDDEQYPLPTAQDLYFTLAGSKVISKLDLTHAYEQMSVDEVSQKYLCTTKLPFCVKSAPKIFQATMDKILWLRAVISHVMDDGQERPIAFASRTLSASEKNYAQVEKDALSLVFGVKRFHQFF